MRYLCNKLLAIGGKTYHPGEVIPDGVILPERSGKLMRSGHISEMKGETGQNAVPGADETVIQIVVKASADGSEEAILARPEEIRRVFSVMQMDAADGVKVIAEVEEENVLILLHAADSRKTIKGAARERIDKLFPPEEEQSGASGDNACMGTDTEGDGA